MPTVHLKCFCDAGDSSMTWSSLPNCGHIYHTDCITTWHSKQKKNRTRRTCPNCRTDAQVYTTRSISLEAGGDATKLCKASRYSTRLYFDGELDSDPASQMDPLSDPLRFFRAGKARAQGEDDFEDDDDIEDDDAPPPPQGEVNALRKSLEDKTIEHREALNSVRDLSTRSRTLEKQVQDLTVERDKLLEDTTTGSAERDRLISEKQALEDELEERNLEVEQLQEGQPDLHAQIDQFETDIEMKNLEIEKLSTDLIEMDKIVKQVEREKEELKDDASTKIRGYKYKIAKLEKDAEKEGDKGKTMVEKLMRDIDDLRVESLHLKAANDGLRAKQEDAIKKLKKKQEIAVRHEREKAEECEKRLTAAEESEARAKMKTRDVEAGLNSHAAKLASKNNKIRALEQELSQLKARRPSRAIADEDEEENFPSFESPPPSKHKASQSAATLRFSPSSSPPKFTIKASTSASTLPRSAVKRKRPEEIVISSDEEEAASPIKAGRRDLEEDSDDDTGGLQTLVGSSRSFAMGKGKERQKELSKLSQDVHLPSLGGGGVMGQGPKNKVKAVGRKKR